MYIDHSNYTDANIQGMLKNDKIKQLNKIKNYKKGV